MFGGWVGVSFSLGLGFGLELGSWVGLGVSLEVRLGVGLA